MTNQGFFDADKPIVRYEMSLPKSEIAAWSNKIGSVDGKQC